MSLIIIVSVSLLLSFVFALWFKKTLVLLLTIIIPSAIILEIIITKDISAFYYRYYYHWLFLLPLLLILPFSFLKDIKKTSKIIKIIFLVWIVLVIIFPLKIVINNIKYLNSDTMWFDQFSQKYALHQISIYDYIDWQYPKTKGIIKWCENQKNMTNLYHSYLDQFYDMNENELHAFFINCKLSNLEIEKGKTIEQIAGEILKTHKGAYYLSSEKCQPNINKLFNNIERLNRYNLDQKLVCASKEVMPYLYIFPQ